MNIGSFMKLVGDIQPAANRVLELRPGQTVRATVVEAGPGANEALLQIGDNQLVAKLETPLKAGQTASLQVQGETPEGLLLLKLADKTAQGTGEPDLEQWKELAAKLGLPGKDSGAALLTELRAAGLPLTRETAAAVATAAALKPEGADAAEWLRAAASAIQRGLPGTQEILLALRQAMSGPPVHELLGKLQQELEAWKGSRQAGVVAQPASAAAPGTAGGPAGAGELTLRSSQLEGNVSAAKGAASASSGGDAAARLLTLLKEGGGWIAPDNTERGNQAGIAGKADPNEAVGAKQISASSLPPSGLTASDAAANEAVPAEPRSELMRGGDKPALSAAASSAGGAVQGTAASVKAFLKWMGTSHEHALLELPVQQRKGAGEPRTGTYQPANPGSAAQAVGDETAANAGSRTTEGQITRMAAGFQMGLPIELAGETAQRAAGGSYSGNAGDSAAAVVPHAGTQQAMKADAPGGIRTGENSTDGQAEAAAGKFAGILNEKVSPSEARATTAFALPIGALAEGQREVTLKAVLLQLLEQPDVPAALKEAGNQLMQQITGQQLLLSPERSGIFFSQLSLQLPIKTPDGESTATVQVQTRRGGKGAVDAANCRLLFQLELSSLGTTAIDVHVVDKVVSLTVYGANPVIPQLLEAGRPELNNRLQESGYRLLGLRAGEPKPAVPVEGDQAGETGKSSGPPQWSQDVYRGVDLKV